MPDRGLQAVPRGLDRDLTTCLQALRTEILRLSGMVRGSENSRAVRASEAVPFRVGAGSSSSGVDVGAIASQILRDGAVTERKLADRAVSNRKLANNAVDVRVIAPGAVENTALAEHCVSTGKIQDGAVSGSKLATGAVTEGKIAPGAVSASRLARGAVGTDTLQAGCITADKIAQGVIPVVPDPPVLPVWVTGTAWDGETVAIPGIWEDAPRLFLSAFSCVLPEPVEPEPAPEPPLPEPDVSNVPSKPASKSVVPESQRLVVGPEQLMEVWDTDGMGTGVWTFVARGDFSWIAMGKGVL